MKRATAFVAWCAECGPLGKTDEDGCCLACGRDAVGPGAKRALHALAAAAETVRLRKVIPALISAAQSGWGHEPKDKRLGECSGCDAIVAARAALRPVKP